MQSQRGDETPHFNWVCYDDQRRKKFQQDPKGTMGKGEKGKKKGAKMATTGLDMEEDALHLNMLSEELEDFLYAAEFGDTPTIRRMLHDFPDIDVNASDILGRSALRLAVGNEHLEIVELLLDKSNVGNVYEALLLAINSDHEQIAEAILRHPSYDKIAKTIRVMGQSDIFYSALSDLDSQFSADITPLILAAQRNQYGIVQYLLMRGDTIIPPHSYNCCCTECTEKVELDQLRYSKMRLNNYKGLASEAYISLSSKDPILTAFQLGRELKNVANFEKYFKTEYLQLAAGLSDYVVKLLDKVRSHEELETILNETNGSTLGKREKLARLKLAIFYDEKKFTAHATCQQKLVSIWYAGMLNIERKGAMMKFFLHLGHILLLPFLTLAYWIAPKTKIGRYLSYPYMKFMANTVSYMIFLALIVVFSLTESPADEYTFSQQPGVKEFYKEYTNKSYNTNGVFLDDFYVRPHLPNVMDYILSVWVVGLVWQECKQLYGEGLEGFVDSWFNLMDFSMLTGYLASFVLRFLVRIKVTMALDFFTHRSSWESLVNGDPRSVYKQYWLIADRYYWNAWDPQHVCEGLFAIANVLSFSRISSILSTSDVFGPLQRSLGRMVSDLLKFFIVAGLVFLAFMIALFNLFWYYDDATRRSAEMPKAHPHEITNAQLSFGEFELTFRTVFWSLFGMTDADVVELQEYDSKFTTSVGYILFGAYNCTMVIVILNMLIAMMARSYDQVAGVEDVEWKFARTQLFMEFIKEGSTLPVPFNIIPTPKAIYYFFRSIYRTIHDCCFPKKRQSKFQKSARDVQTIKNILNNMGEKAKNTKGSDLPDEGPIKLNNVRKIDNNLEQEENVINIEDVPNISNHERVMKRIVKRFIFESQAEEDGATEGDFAEIKQDISSFRYDVLNYLNSQQRVVKDNRKRLNELNQHITNLDEKLDLLLDENIIRMKHLEKLLTKTMERSSLANEGGISPEDTKDLGTETLSRWKSKSRKPILKSQKSSSLPKLDNNNTVDNDNFDQTDDELDPTVWVKHNKMNRRKAMKRVMNQYSSSECDNPESPKPGDGTSPSAVDEGIVGKVGMVMDSIGGLIMGKRTSTSDV
ncbi:unnamed protein product [Owenia fusiformis]|uniref:Uncharacterized protein n=1 Tax=Owenia fusiformis TaxID=6347 RepID=A0A8J1TWU9_OWEFU|nr:unnamed protein product [Owenia fusiformis]